MEKEGNDSIKPPLLYEIVLVLDNPIQSGRFDRLHEGPNLKSIRQKVE